MFSSLRSRLLLTYALVIGMVLCVVGVALVWYLLRNPVIDRQMYTRLEGVAETIIQKDILSSSSLRCLEEVLQRIDQQQGMRVLVVSETGEVVADSRSEDDAGLTPTVRRALQLKRGIAWDANKKAWLFVWRPLEDGSFLVMATPRIGRVSLLFTQRLRDVLRDDLLPPLIQAGVAALVLALILALWMSRWIAAPLQRVVEATRSVPTGEYHEVPVGGPSEVQSLARAFNRMSAQVQASQRSQRDFVANVSHELKTPLTSIQGFAQAILDGTAKKTTELQQAGEVIYTEAGRMHHMVLDLLDLARLDAGTAELQRAPVDLIALLQNILRKLTPQASQAQVDLTYKGDSMPVLIGDGDRLAQVFTNLVDNAIKNTPPGGQVRIRAAAVSDFVEISVEDTGAGIPPEELPRIFERFYQVDKSRPGGEGRGTGLGLAIAQEIVLAHGGTISVRSRPGQGSVFVVKIPVARSGDAPLTTRRKD